MNAYAPMGFVDSTSVNEGEKLSKPKELLKHWKMIISVLLGLIVISFVIWLSMKKKSENFKPIETFFIPMAETQRLLKTDFDGYAKQYDAVNLEACGVPDHEDLLAKWVNSVQDWKPAEFQRLKDASQIADYAINTKLKDPFRAQINSIPWQFAKTIHPYYLEGLPHTRGDIIFLTDKILQLYSPKQLASLLLHEKAHVWQRKYPEEIQGWIERHNFQKVHPISSEPLYRMNPDEDGWIYVNSSEYKLGTKFKNAQPKDLFDVYYSRELEHPYEQFAYRIEKILD